MEKMNAIQYIAKIEETVSLMESIANQSSQEYTSNLNKQDEDDNIDLMSVQPYDVTKEGLPNEPQIWTPESELNHDQKSQIGVELFNHLTMHTSEEITPDDLDSYSVVIGANNGFGFNKVREYVDQLMNSANQKNEVQMTAGTPAGAEQAVEQPVAQPEVETPVEPVVDLSQNVEPIEAPQEDVASDETSELDFSFLDEETPTEDNSSEVTDLDLGDDTAVSDEVELTDLDDNNAVSDDLDLDLDLDLGDESTEEVKDEEVKDEEVKEDGDKEVKEDVAEDEIKTKLEAIAKKHKAKTLVESSDDESISTPNFDKALSEIEDTMNQVKLEARLESIAQNYFKTKEKMTMLESIRTEYLSKGKSGVKKALDILG